MKLQTEAILNYWYGAWPFNSEKVKQQASKWYAGSNEIDAEIQQLFAPQIEAALSETLDFDKDDLDSQLACIILLDQFTRNVYRGTVKAFIGDPLALKYCLVLVKQQYHIKLPTSVACFMCMPLEHSEDLEMQKKSVITFEEIAQNAKPSEQAIAEDVSKYAHIHYDIIAQFGRFPHRNSALNRDSTEAEISYLNDGAQRFGQ